mmetsp:Transcript_42552/g.113690  ORF Transcript_42552/g.113690 Transcript_42552/m.113690 type:complete len:917 (-) Transcript_42552:1125-3875(-)
MDHTPPTLPRSAVDGDQARVVASAVVEFERGRREKKAKRYNGVIKLGLVSIGVGCFVYLGGFILRYALYQAGWGVIILGWWFIAMGVVTMSTIPHTEIDFDNYLEERHFVRVCIAIGAFAYAVQRQFRYPYLDIATAVPLALLAVRNRQDRLLCTTALGSWFYLIACSSGFNYIMWITDDNNIGLQFKLQKNEGTLKYGWRESALVPMCVCVGVLYLVGAQLVLITWKRRSQRFKVTLGAEGSSPTDGFYETMYSYLAGAGGINVILGAWLNFFSSPNAYALMSFGFVVAIPPITIFTLGRNRVFQYMARKFDSENAANDGAFVAELLATATASVGEPWWIMRKQPLEDLPNDDRRKYWAEGVVVSIDPLGDTLTVKLNAPLNALGPAITVDHRRPSQADALRAMIAQHNAQAGGGGHEGDSDTDNDTHGSFNTGSFNNGSFSRASGFDLEPPSSNRATNGTDSKDTAADTAAGAGTVGTADAGAGAGAATDALSGAAGSSRLSESKKKGTWPPPARNSGADSGADPGGVSEAPAKLSSGPFLSHPTSMPGKLPALTPSGGDGDGGSGQEAGGGDDHGEGGDKPSELKVPAGRRRGSLKRNRSADESQAPSALLGSRSPATITSNTRFAEVEDTGSAGTTLHTYHHTRHHVRHHTRHHTDHYTTPPHTPTYTPPHSSPPLPYRCSPTIGRQLPPRKKSIFTTQKSTPLLPKATSSDSGLMVDPADRRKKSMVAGAISNFTHAAAEVAATAAEVASHAVDIVPHGHNPRRLSLTAPDSVPNNNRRPSIGNLIGMGPSFGAAAVAPELDLYKEVQIQGRSMPAAELMELAQKTLRCVDFTNLSLDLMMMSSGSQDTYNLSRPVRDGETIDYFLSHSWHDDPLVKWSTLVGVAERHKRRHAGKAPTFWLDKVGHIRVLS